ncbi:hypothetical protein CcCBS67573_g07355 [Chytriomyces confervae]|uniref:Cyclin N-terminal domain-containing protein n=1 Tax=Chytriomyces confervae TaxID=246404 RepID=A0A507EVE1_9FUNG|nr:hypothetical protein CcCBS67573_g07355 [Chytriomyces confervae]
MKVEIPAALYALLQQQSQLASAQKQVIHLAPSGPCDFLNSAKPPIPNTDPSKSRAGFVDRLVDTSANIIESIWPTPAPQNASSKVLPLKVFIQEILRRSKTSFSTLQLALFYIIRLRNQIEATKNEIRVQSTLMTFTASSKTESEFTLASPPMSPNVLEGLRPISPSTHVAGEPLPACGRRVFLTALILASKYLQDRNYSNKAWSKISGLAVSEINANEFQFLSLINYDLFVGHQAFSQWTVLLMAKTQQLQQSQQLQNTVSAPLMHPAASSAASCVPCEKMPLQELEVLSHLPSPSLKGITPPSSASALNLLASAAVASPSYSDYPSPLSVAGLTPTGSAAGLKRALTFDSEDSVKKTCM